MILSPLALGIEVHTFNPEIQTATCNTNYSSTLRPCAATLLDRLHHLPAPLFFRNEARESRHVSPHTKSRNPANIKVLPSVTSQEGKSDNNYLKGQGT